MEGKEMRHLKTPKFDLKIDIAKLADEAFYIFLLVDQWPFK